MEILFDDVTAHVIHFLGEAAGAKVGISQEHSHVAMSRNRLQLDQLKTPRFGQAADGLVTEIVEMQVFNFCCRQDPLEKSLPQRVGGQVEQASIAAFSRQMQREKRTENLHGQCSEGNLAAAPVFGVFQVREAHLEVDVGR